MKKIGSLLIKLILVGAVVAFGIVIWNGRMLRPDNELSVQTTQYGAFLAAQHAVYVNDFDMAARFSEVLNEEAPVVQNVKIMSAFLNGQMPENATALKKESGTPARLIYDAYLVNNDKSQQ